MVVSSSFQKKDTPATISLFDAKLHLLPRLQILFVSKSLKIPWSSRRASPLPLSFIWRQTFGVGVFCWAAADKGFCTFGAKVLKRGILGHHLVSRLLADCFRIPVAHGIDRTILPQAPERKFPLKDSTILFRTPSRSQSNSEHPDFKFTFEIALGETDIANGYPLVPTLCQLSKTVTDLLDLFSSLFP